MGINQVQEALAQCNAIIAEATQQMEVSVIQAAQVLNKALQQQAASQPDSKAAEQETKSEPSGETVTMDAGVHKQLLAQLQVVKQVVDSHPELFRDIKL